MSYKIYKWKLKYKISTQILKGKSVYMLKAEEYNNSSIELF